jgi:hypothetical protein
VKRALAQWLHQIGIALSQLASAISFGWADEPLSARLYRLDRQGSRIGGALRRALDAAAAALCRQSCHCSRSYVARSKRAQTPPEERS